MKEVSIYIASSIRGRWNRDGYIGYCLEYYRDGCRYPETLTDYERVEGLNENRAEMEALIRAFARMREKCVLSVYTENEYLYKGFAGDANVEKWIRNGWKTSRGTEVKAPGQPLYVLPERDKRVHGSTARGLKAA